MYIKNILHIYQQKIQQSMKLIIFENCYLYLIQIN